ncbi:MAG: cysteine desulfurase/selenocysteine lyase [Planctomycetota bacterium]
MSGYDVARVRADFPVLHQEIKGKPLVYLDNAATAQKPTAVIDAMGNHDRRDNANVHRGVHTLSMRSTNSYEGARKTMQRFIGAATTEEVIFTRGTTEGINLVAQSWGRANLKPGDEVLVSQMEHHSNIVPWQMVCAEMGATVRMLPIDDAGCLCLDQLPELLTERTRLVAVGHVSNALGTINPIKEIVAAAKAVGALVLVDGAQATPHLSVDVQDLGCDFYALSAHKMYGPTGIGVLWGRRELLEEMPPWQGGGDMILSVSFDETTYNQLPYKFEAGTPSITAAIGMGAAAEYLSELGLENIAAHEHALLTYAAPRLQEIPGLRLVGTAEHKAAVISFLIEGLHPHDIGTIVDEYGVAIRTGHHCAQPVMDRFGISSTARASFGLYNTTADVDRLIDALNEVRTLFGL